MKRREGGRRTEAGGGTRGGGGAQEERGLDDCGVLVADRGFQTIYIFLNVF